MHLCAIDMKPPPPLQSIMTAGALLISVDINNFCDALDATEHRHLVFVEIRDTLIVGFDVDGNN